MAEKDDETTEFWLPSEHADLACRVAALHRQRRELQEEKPPREVEIVRRTVAELFINGAGIEIGAGTRPFPLPPGAICLYGDTRSEDELKRYFKSDAISATSKLDAQTFNGIALKSLDFIISAHVIEHLEDPIGSIVNGLSRLRAGGIYVLAVPDMRFTFDRQRPPTPLTHLLKDAADGGESTRAEAYRDFLIWTSMAQWGIAIATAAIESEVARLSQARMDIHFHVWTGESFDELLHYLAERHDFEIAGRTFAVNENIFVLRSK